MQRHWRGGELIESAMGGLVWLLGDQARPPVKYGLYQAANQAAFLELGEPLLTRVSFLFSEYGAPIHHDVF